MTEPAATLTVLSDRKNKLTKTLSLKGGSLIVKASGHVVNGTAISHTVTSAQLLTLIKTLKPRECLCNGIVQESDILDTVKISPTGVTRSNEFFEYRPGIPGWCLLDVDTDTPVEEFQDILFGLDPSLAAAPTVISPSVTSGLTSTEIELSPKSKFHYYFGICDMSQIPAYCDWLYHKLILAGYGSVLVYKNVGRTRIDTLIDPAVWKGGQCREIFEADPILGEGLSSDRSPSCSPGSANIENIPTLTPKERVDFDLIVADLLAAPAVQAEVEAQTAARDLIRLKSKTSGKTVTSFNLWEDASGVAHANIGISESLYLNDGSQVSVYDAIELPDGTGMPDPLNPWKRGDESQGKPGRDIARMRTRSSTGARYIYSFYCDIEYDFVWDLDAVQERVEELSDENFTDDFSDLLDQIADTPYELSISDADIRSLSKFATRRGKKTKTANRTLTGNAAIKEQLTPDRSTPDRPTQKTSSVISRENSQMGMVLVGGKTKVISERYSADTGEWSTNLVALKELKELRLNETTEVSKFGEKVTVPVMEYWQEHQNRNTYRSVVFRPNGRTVRHRSSDPVVIQQGGDYNLWLGYHVRPESEIKSKSIRKILWHIKYVWCDGSQELFRYTLAWFSELFQHPERVGQTHLVLKSVEGAGKNIILDNIVSSLLGPHAITTSKKSDLTGNFNSHLAINTLLFLDEVDFTGDLEATNMLKALTNSYKLLEYKGVDKIKSVNYTKIIIATNADNVLSLSQTDRRFTYLPVSGRCRDNEEYFEGLMKEIEDGGREGFLDFMLRHKHEINLRKVPETAVEARTEDQISALSLGTKFVFDLMIDGPVQFDTSERVFSDTEFRHFERKGATVSKPDLYAMFKVWKKVNEHMAPVTRHAFIRSIAHVLYASTTRVPTAKRRAVFPLHEDGYKNIVICSQDHWDSLTEAGVIMDVLFNGHPAERTYLQQLKEK